MQNMLIMLTFLSVSLCVIYSTDAEFVSEFFCSE